MPIRDHILRVAGDLFYRRGIRAVGVDMIIAEANVAKATLYRQFRSRDELVRAYLEGWDELVIANLKDRLDRPELSGRDKIVEIFLLLREKAETPAFRGCAFLIAVAESEGSEQVMAIAKAHKKTFLDIFISAASDFASDPESLGKDIALCYEGALANIALQRSSEPAERALRIVEKLIDLAGASKLHPDHAQEVSSPIGSAR